MYTMSTKLAVKQVHKSLRDVHVCPFCNNSTGVTFYEKNGRMRCIMVCAVCIAIKYNTLIDERDDIFTINDAIEFLLRVNPCVNGDSMIAAMEARQKKSSAK